ncbi:CoxG family protein [Sinorhizobium psoraleae]|uniref:CoxG family protein n=1 Tax=Sinorhizobium psoraleae TaxID=520838 RepID=UPI0035E3CA24
MLARGRQRITGDVVLSDLTPPHSCRISGKGAGGIAGFAEGGATMSLAAAGEGTLLRYNVDAQVGGKLAQLGARLIDSTAKKLAQEFFQRLEVQITELA